MIKDIGAFDWLDSDSDRHSDHLVFAAGREAWSSERGRHKGASSLLMQARARRSISTRPRA